MLSLELPHEKGLSLPKYVYKWIKEGPLVILQNTMQMSTTN